MRPEARKSAPERSDWSVEDSSFGFGELSALRGG
jgi:hypothetical protein